MSLKISEFKAALSGGSRPNLFQVAVTSPAGLTTKTNATTTSSSVPLANLSILCKATSLPGMTIGVIEVPFRGRRVKVPGDRTFAEWTMTVVADEGHAIRKDFETWMTYINDNDFDAEKIRSGGQGDYKTVITIQKLTDSGSIANNGTYILQDAFPSDVSQIDVSYDTMDAVEEFTVTFNYSYFTVAAPATAAPNAATVP